jgi:beta-lactamase class D
MRAFAVAIVLASLSLASAQEPPRALECFLVAGPGTPTPLVSNADECGLPTSPASTFKIPHALIALETGVITPETVFRWDGTAHEFPSWRTDHTLASAIRASVLPFFRNTSRLIGKARMASRLLALAYAGDAFEGTGDFWVNGDLAVSPREQLAFLQRFFDGKLPASTAHLAVVGEALRMPAGQVLLAGGPQPFVLDRPDLVVRAKTGNTRVNGERVSWLVGAVEAEGARYTFVARARGAGELPPLAGAEVARRGLNALRRR